MKPEDLGVALQEVAGYPLRHTCGRKVEYSIRTERKYCPLCGDVTEWVEQYIWKRCSHVKED